MWCAFDWFQINPIGWLTVYAALYFEDCLADEFIREDYRLGVDLEVDKVFEWGGTVGERSIFEFYICAFLAVWLTGVRINFD